MILLIQNANAQLIEPGQFVDDHVPRFNRDSIVALGISTIFIRYTDKPSSHPIYDRGKRVVMNFDSAGHLVKLTYAFPLRNRGVDTNFHYWTWQGNQLVEELEIKGAYQRKTRYFKSAKGKDGREILVKHKGEEWQTVGKEDVIRDTTKTGFSVAFATSGNEPYETEITELSNDSVKISRYFYGSRLSKTKTWTTADKHITFSERYTAETIPYRLIEYDLEGNRISKGTWCKKGECLDWDILYENGLPKAWFLINPITQDMEILEFRYLFLN